MPQGLILSRCRKILILSWGTTEIIHRMPDIGIIPMSEKTRYWEKRFSAIILWQLQVRCINGVGNYYIEAQTRDARRTDVIVDYRGEQFIIELKIWHGNEYNERGEEQLSEYLDYYHKDKGYMLSFNFNRNKEIGVKEIKLGNKTIVEAVV